jgi:hypothetical protein
MIPISVSYGCTSGKFISVFGKDVDNIHELGKKEQDQLINYIKSKFFVKENNLLKREIFECLERMVNDAQYDYESMCEQCGDDNYSWSGAINDSD